MQLKEIATVKGGKRLPKTDELVSYKTEHPYIRIRDMYQTYPLELNSEFEFITDETHEKIKRYIVNHGDVIIAVVGNTIGLVSLIGSSLDGANLTENCNKLVELHDYDNRFLYYFLTSKEGQDEIKKGIVGSSQPKLPIYNIEKIEIPDISYKQQIKIVKILESIDKKISNNEAINRNLSEQAKVIFDEKFGTYSDTNGVIGDLGTVITGKTPSTKNDEYYGNDIPFIKTPDMHGSIFLTDVNEYLSRKGADSQKGKYIPAYSVMMSCIGAGAGEMGIASERSQFNQQINAVVSEYPCLTWFVLQSKIDYLRSIGSAGSTMININKSTFESCPIFIPSKDERDSFEKMVRPLFDDILCNQKQNAKLSLLRDSLLTKLMSGELDVSELDI